METTNTFSSREILTKSGKLFDKLYRCRKQVKHYYIYFHDELLGGPCYFKISSYLPFPCEFYFNGHHAIANQLDQKGIGYKMKDNAFVEIDELSTFQEIAESFEGKEVLDRIQYWRSQLFKFNKGQYSTCSKYLNHEWFLSQVEICSNGIFKSPFFGTRLFERLIDKFVRFGSPESLIQVFEKKRLPKKTKSTWRLYDNNACLKYWFKRNSIKMYNKLAYFFRFETTINDPKSLGLEKSIVYLKSYYWKGFECNKRFMNCCADVDTDSLATEEVRDFTQPVTQKNGRRVTAMDPRKDRQLSLFSALLSPKHAIHGFRTRDLLEILPSQFRNSAEIRYELAKLRARNLVKKEKGKCFYRVSELGWKWLWCSICASREFTNPLISMSCKESDFAMCGQPSDYEESCRMLNTALSRMTKGFAMI